MGKGGYIGGSTIIYLRPSKIDLKDNSDPERSKIFKCKICGIKNRRIYHFEHLETHGLKGCVHCGEAYSPEDKSSHTCLKCGKVTLISLKKRTLPNKKSENKSKKPNKNSVIKVKEKYKKCETIGVKLGELLDEAFEKKNKCITTCSTRNPQRTRVR